MMTTHEVIAQLGGRITYRQLDYWIRTGAITIGDTRNPGSGNRRRFSPVEVAALNDFVDMYERVREASDLIADGSGWQACIAKHRPHLVPNGGVA
jgi:hypothetical protein